MTDTLDKPHIPLWQTTISRRMLVSDTALLVYLALVKFLIHLLTGANYGFFRDELYYIDAGKHLSFGYVEFPAFIGLMAAFIHSIFGDSLLAYHMLPALAGACVVLLSGLIARELGGGRFAQCLAALASLVTGIFLGIDALFSMDSFDELWWVLAVFLLILLIKRNQPRFWLLFALAAGMGLLTKLTILMFGFAIVVGLLLTPERKYLWSKWAWLGGALVCVFLLPYILWNVANGWPTLQFWSSYGSGHANPVDALGFLSQQIIAMNPLTLPLWFTGLAAYFFNRQLRPYRALGWAFVVLYVLFTATHAKVYFLSPAYPMLFAAGALIFERFFKQHHWRWPQPTYMVSLVLVGIVLSPIVIPILPPAIYGQTMGFVGGNAGVKVEQRTTGVLPQQLADRFGWDSMTTTVAQVFHHLPLDEQAKACILTENYGEAGAIDLYGPTYHLPQAISGHNTYYLWGPGKCTGEVMITIGYPINKLQPFFGSITQAGLITCTYCMPAENNLPVYVGRHLKGSLQAIWPQMKNYS
jgi:Dolichyl-phosphate-mannose-protein mannosyltransferase